MTAGTHQQPQLGKAQGGQFPGSSTISQHYRSGNMQEHLAAQSLGNSYGGATFKHKTPFGVHTDPRSTYFSESHNSLKSRPWKVAPDLKKSRKSNDTDLQGKHLTYHA